MNTRYYNDQPDRAVYDPTVVKHLIVSFVLAYSAEHGYSPSIREIGDGVNLKSTATTQKYVNELVAERRLERDPKRIRTLRVVA